MVVTFIVIGIFAGLLSGLFGLGGGIIIVPGLVHFAKFPIKMATGTSLGVFLIPAGIFGAYTYWKAGNLVPRASLLIAVGVMLGAFVSARLAQHLSGTLLQRLFAVFLVVMAVRLWLRA